MIQYKYFHPSGRYIYRMSIDQSDAYYDYHLNLFEKLRLNVSGEGAFAYVVLDDAAVFVQSSISDNHAFVHEIYCANGEVAELPHKYIGNLETSIKNAENVPDVLDSKIKLVASRTVDRAYRKRVGDKKLLPKLIDALLFDIRKVIIMADGNEAVDYLLALSYVLPEKVVRTLGFCIGSDSVSTDDIEVNVESDKCGVAKIDIWAPKMSNFSYNNYAADYYIFDVRSTPRTNYERPASPIAAVIEGFDLTNESEVNSFKSALEGVFSDDGDIDIEELERVSAIYAFRANRSFDSAKKILFSNAIDDEYLKREALDIVLGNLDELSPSEKNQVLSLDFGEDATESVGDEMTRHLAEKESLSAEEKQILSSLIEKDETGARLSAIYDEKRRMNDFGGMVEIFGSGCAILEKVMSRRGFKLDDERVKQLVINLLNMVDVRNIFNAIPTQQAANGEDFFKKVVLGLKNEEARQTVTAILMASAYSVCGNRGTEKTIADIRNIGLRALLDIMKKSGKTDKENLEFVVHVRSKLIEISECIEDMKINANLFFYGDKPIGVDAIRRRILHLSMADTLEIYNLVSQREHIEGRSFDGMSDELTKRLLDEKFVTKEVKSNRGVTQAYTDFFNALNQQKKSEHSGIKKYIESLDREAEISEEFLNYRCDFVSDCYRTLSPKDKRSVYEGEIASFRDIPTEEKKILAVDETIFVFGTSRTEITRKSTSASSIGIWAFLMSLLSAIVLLIPSFIQSLTLEIGSIEEYIDCVVDFIRPEFMFIPLGVYLMDVISYFVIKIVNAVKKTNINETKNANLITLICGILPLLVFVLSFALFYHLSI